MQTYKTILATSPPETLFHYTTQEGLLGIIKSKELWATKIHFLNDSKEYALALELAQSQLEGYLKKAVSTLEKDVFETSLEELEKIVSINICVFSFSEQGDVLSQWRGYAGSGTGYSIGFYSKTLKELAKKNGFVLAPCIYDKSRQMALIDDVIKESLSKAGPTLGPQGEFANMLMKIAPMIKNESFTEEREWRLISGPISSKELDYRSGASMIIPHFRFPLCDDQARLELSDVIIGPTPHRELSCEALTSLFISRNVEFRSISPSSIPFRNW